MNMLKKIYEMALLGLLIGGFVCAEGGDGKQPPHTPEKQIIGRGKRKAEALTPETAQAAATDSFVTPPAAPSKKQRVCPEAPVKGIAPQASSSHGLPVGLRTPQTTTTTTSVVSPQPSHSASLSGAELPQAFNCPGFPPNVLWNIAGRIPGATSGPSRGSRRCLFFAYIEKFRAFSQAFSLPCSFQDQAEALMQNLRIFAKEHNLSLWQLAQYSIELGWYSGFKVLVLMLHQQEIDSRLVPDTRKWDNLYYWAMNEDHVQIFEKLLEYIAPSQAVKPYIIGFSKNIKFLLILAQKNLVGFDDISKALKVYIGANRCTFDDELKRSILKLLELPGMHQAVDINVLAEACYVGDEELFTRLLTCAFQCQDFNINASIDSWIKGTTLLMLVATSKAATVNDCALIKILLIHGANINAMREDGQTVLDLALKDVKSFLIENGALSGLEVPAQLSA